MEDPQYSHPLRIRLQLMAQHQNTKTGRTGLDLRKIPDLRKTLNICKTFNIRRILLLLDDRSGAYGVSKVRKDKAGGPVLDAEEVTVLLSSNAKG